MKKNKRLEISKDTIDVFSNFIKINTQLWISSGYRQSVITPYSSSHLLIALIKENFPPKLLPNWNGERGFGIYDGDLFVKALKEVKVPVLDFSNIISTLIIHDKKNLNKKIEIDVVSPDEIKRVKEHTKFIPDMDLEIHFSVDDINQMKKMGQEIEVSKNGNGYASFKNIDSNKGMTTENIISSYSPKEHSFRFVYKTDQMLMPSGDYKVSFSEKGISSWVNLTDRKYIFYMALEKGGYIGKPKSPTELISMTQYKPIKKISPKEYKNINSYSKAIQTSWRKGVDAIIETGELLSYAKQKFYNNEFLWQSFLNTLPFGIRSIEKLIYISKNKELLLDERIYNNLPPSWSTLYEICTIGKEKPITIYENGEGETSPVKEIGFNKITLDKKDFVLKAIEERVSTDGKKVPVIRTDMTRKDIETFKKKIEFNYYPSNKTEVKKSKDKEVVFFIKFKPNSPKKEISDFENKLDKLIKNNEWINTHKTI